MFCAPKKTGRERRDEEVTGGRRNRGNFGVRRRSGDLCGRHSDVSGYERQDGANSHRPQLRAVPQKRASFGVSRRRQPRLVYRALQGQYLPITRSARSLATASIAQRLPILFAFCMAWRSVIAHPAKNLKEPCRPQHGAPHVSRRTAVEAEPLFRLLEMTADDVREVVKVDLRVGIE